MKKRISESDFDELVQSLQDKSFSDAKSAFGEIGFERWRNPKFNGPIVDADSHASLTGKCGDTIQLFLKFNDDIVQHASYVTDGCGSSTLSGSFTAELAVGCSPEELFKLTAEDVLQKIGRLPEDDQHCATLAVETLHECVNKYLIKQNR